jgi:hypothetical protein
VGFDGVEYSYQKSRRIKTMSVPLKKIEQTPESYSPKSKPEILRMAEENARIERLEEFVQKTNVELVTLHEEIKVVGLSFNKCKHNDLLALASPFDLYSRESFELQDHINNIRYPQVGYAVAVMANAIPDLIVGKCVTDIHGQDEIYGSYIIPTGRYMKISFNAKTFEELVQKKLPKSEELSDAGIFLESRNLLKDNALYIEVYPHESCCVGQENGPAWGPKYLKASMAEPTTKYPEMYTLHTVKERV